ncbi:MAG: OAM dimerization domain-containing protein [Bradymonadaceae bacterium]
MTAPSPLSDPTDVRPYGDSRGDGRVQMSFTLPVEAGPEADEAARRLTRNLGFDDPRVYHARDLGEGFTFFVVYASATVGVDLTDIEVPSVDAEAMSFDEIEEFARTHVGRPIVVVGACTGTDAHSVGIDAIMNPKGYGGEHGLERYSMFEAHNLGMQVPNEELVARAAELDADALLVSQVVTQNDAHVENLAELVDMLEAERIRNEVVAVCGGPRITHELALELGFDAGFGADTTPSEVACYIAERVAARQSD